MLTWIRADGSHLKNSLPAGPPHLRKFISDLPVIPAQNPRDLFYREAAHQHVAQLGQLRLGPFPFGVHGRLFVLSRGALRINDRGPNDAE